ncbi:hypothetical protein ACFXGA_06090 [Actinosynnema sp. NPDC059335]|uniref:hypothetical protein n=1 Tax=Actinosynnema sp. NPDC059335 TaxID=3346804 RepID=UPI0036705FD4
MAEWLLPGLGQQEEQGPPSMPSTGLPQDALDELTDALGTPQFHAVAARLLPIPEWTDDV